MSIAYLCHFKHGVLSLWRPFWIWGTVSLPRTLVGCNWWRIQLAKCTFTSWCHCDRTFSLCAFPLLHLAFQLPLMWPNPYISCWSIWFSYYGMNSLQFYKFSLVFTYVFSLYRESNPEIKSVFHKSTNLFDKTLKNNNN